MPKIDVIIPTYKPGRELFGLLDRLCGQTLRPERILLINTGEKYFQQLIYGTRFLDQYRDVVQVHHVSEREFDHGGTRRLGVKRTQSEIFVMMTQDAMPQDETLLERLVEPLLDESGGGKVAVSYARQIPREDCGEAERFGRSFNYPEISCVKTKADLERLGIKTFFCSNVCAAYRRDLYEELGGFVRHTIFNEDMIFAANAIKAGYGVAYAARAQVIHSHNYTNREQLRRNFDLGVSQAQHPEVFRGVRSESEGKRLVKDTTRHLRERGMSGRIPGFYVQCGCKYLGYLLGKHYRVLPDWLVRRLSANPGYWEREKV